ncbi:MAG: regulatory protein RecX, partial [bacterium]
SDLKAQNLVDDKAFALTYVRSRMVNKPAGQILLRRELWQKGIGEEIIEKALQEAYRDKDQLEVARELVKKRRTRYKDLDHSKRKKRLADFLVRRGFEWEVVKEVIEEKSGD